MTQKKAKLVRLFALWIESLYTSNHRDLLYFFRFTTNNYNRYSMTQDIKIAPSILSADFGHLADELTAIDKAGAVLAQHYPPTDGQKNELDDRLIEI